jgi:hypothetical protein
MFQQCWYRTIAEQGNKAIRGLKSSAFKLTDPIEMMLSCIAQFQLANDGITPILLSLDVFQSIWWTGSERFSFAQALLKAINAKERKILKEQRAISVPEVKKKEVLLNFPDSDHGMHLLQDNLEESTFNEVISYINKSRTKFNPKARRITLKTIEERRVKCQRCQNQTYVAGLSIAGIYYAPPGSGKTISQNQGLVGFDTDWIGLGLTRLDYSLILKKRIPTITNQPEAFIGCGLKIIGIVKALIPVGTNGKPLDSKRQVLEWAEMQTCNVVFLLLFTKQV